MRTSVAEVPQTVRIRRPPQETAGGANVKVAAAPPVLCSRMLPEPTAQMSFGPLPHTPRSVPGVTGVIFFQAAPPQRTTAPPEPTAQTSWLPEPHTAVSV